MLNVKSTIHVILKMEKRAMENLDDDMEFDANYKYIKGYYPEGTRVFDNWLLDIQETFRREALARLTKAKEENGENE